MSTAEDIIRKFGLTPHPVEGGYYRETYRAAEKISGNALPSRYGEDKSFSTAIYYLLTPGTCSLLHRLKTDEIIHFYRGGPVSMLQLFPGRGGTVISLGPGEGEEVQVRVPRGTWMGMELKEGTEYALMGATVAPAFDFSDYEGGKRDELVKKYGEFKEMIIRLTPDEK